MTKTNKKIFIILLIILGVLVSSTAIFLYPRQAPSAKDFSVFYKSNNEENAVKRWFESYLDKHKVKYNFNNPIESYTLSSLEEIVPFSNESGNLNYRVQFIVSADKEPAGLFNTAPMLISNYTYDIVVAMRIDDDKLTYVNDTSYANYTNEMELRAREEDDNDDVSDFYNLQGVTLSVRESVESDWIETPVLSENFDLRSQGWFQNDKQLYVKDNDIQIIYSDPVIKVASSSDKGVTWTHTPLTTQIEDFPLTKGFIDFEGSHGVVVILRNVALNSDVMTIFETFDNGETWNGGETPDRDRSITGVSILDDRIFIAQENNSNLYTTDDFGFTLNEIEIPEDVIPEETDINGGLKWDMVFVQAEVPTLENGIYTLMVNQGESGDYGKNVKAKYISHDKGNTWVFEALIESEW